VTQLLGLSLVADPLLSSNAASLGATNPRDRRRKLQDRRNRPSFPRKIQYAMDKCQPA
jgi:hypothetical protein